MRCERLTLLPVKAHFVFDGKERPRLKRDKNVRGTDHWSADPFWICLVSSIPRLGIPEFFSTVADQLFAANRLWEKPKLNWPGGVDDELSTHESDAILYKAEDIELHPQLGFTSADFVFIALICGGDYSVCPSVF